MAELAELEGHRRAQRGPVRGRRHDRPGRGEERRGVPPRIGITGIVLTKLDGDARGGAALSAAAVTGCPVKFAGVGERVDELRALPARAHGGPHPRHGRRARASSRRPRRSSTASRPRRWSGSCAGASSRSRTTATSWRQMRKMGPLDQVLAMIPGLGAAEGRGRRGQGEREMRRAVAIIDSMTAARAARALGDQRQPAQAHREGQRHHGRGREPPAEAVRAGAEAHEDDGRRGGRHEAAGRAHARSFARFTTRGQARECFRSG